MSPTRRQGPQNVPPAGRFVGAVFGFVFFGIGITVLIFLWAAPFGEFGSPPLFFRVFGSFIALAFVAIGGTVCFTSITGGRGLGPGGRAGGHAVGGSFTNHDGAATGSDGYHCPHCGAPLAEGADVSPHGDAKCGHCNCWFNIHGR